MDHSPRDRGTKHEIWVEAKASPPDVKPREAKPKPNGVLSHDSTHKSGEPRGDRTSSRAKEPATEHDKVLANLNKRGATVRFYNLGKDDHGQEQKKEAGRVRVGPKRRERDAAPTSKPPEVALGSHQPHSDHPRDGSGASGATPHAVAPTADGSARAPGGAPGDRGTGTTAGGKGTHPAREKSVLEDLGDFSAHLAGIVGANPVTADDGSEYGSPFGMNPDGIRDPLVQALGNAVAIGAQILSGALDTQIEKLATALAKTPIGEAIDWGISKAATIAHIRGVFREAVQAERLAGRPLSAAAASRRGYALAEERANALLTNRTVGPYDVFQEFTQGFGSRDGTRALVDQFHAHHLVPEGIITKWGLGDAARGPSVILRGEGHINDIHRALDPLLKQAKTPAAARQILVDFYTTRGEVGWANAVERWFATGGKM
jgi:hypothetical protein